MGKFIKEGWHLHLLVGIIVLILFNKNYHFQINIILAVGKELYDYWDYGKFDIWDIFFTIIPSIVYEIVIGLVV